MSISHQWSERNAINYSPLIFQDLHIFPVSIKDNIVWDGQVDEAYFAQCLEQADLAELVSSLKEKENTKLVQELEECAVNLSGGQSQKLLLARALYKLVFSP